MVYVQYRHSQKITSFNYHVNVLALSGRTPLGICAYCWILLKVMSSTLKKIVLETAHKLGAYSATVNPSKMLTVSLMFISYKQIKISSNRMDSYLLKIHLSVLNKFRESSSNNLYLKRWNLSKRGINNFLLERFKHDSLFNVETLRVESFYRR